MTTSWAFSHSSFCEPVNTLAVDSTTGLQHLLSPSHLLASLPKSVLLSQFYTLVLTLSLRRLPNLFFFLNETHLPSLKEFQLISFSAIISYSSDTPVPRWEAPFIQAPHLSSAPSLLKISPNQEQDLCSQPLFSIFFRQAGLEPTYVTKDVCPSVSTFLVLGLLATPPPFTGSLVLSLSLKAATEIFISWLTPFLLQLQQYQQLLLRLVKHWLLMICLCLTSIIYPTTRP